MIRYRTRLPAAVWFTISGLVMGSAFLHPLLWWVVFPGLVLFLWCLFKTETPRRAFFLGWLVGFVKMLPVLFFVWSVYPLTWIGITSASVQIGLIFGYWVFVALVTGLGYGIIAVLFVAMRNMHWSRAALMCLFPPLLLFGEVCGALAHSVSVLGPGTGVHAGFSFGHSGYVLIEHSVLKWAARVGGVYILTLIVGVLAALFFLGIKGWSHLSRVRRWGVALAATAFFLTGFVSFPASEPSFGTPEADSNTKQIAVVTTFFTSEVLNSEQFFTQYEKRALVSDALKVALERNPSAVILPETTRLGALYESDAQLLEFLKTHTGENDVVLVDSVRAAGPRGDVSRAKIYDTQTAEVHLFDKQYLVALGEYMPFIFSPIFSASQLSEQTQRIIGATTLTSGVDQNDIVLPPRVPNVLFCFEGFAPARAWELTRTREGNPGYIANTVSHAWFKGPQKIFLWRQIDAMLRAQALWSGMHIIQAANMAPSIHYLPDGTTGALTPVYTSSYVHVDMAEI